IALAPAKHLLAQVPTIDAVEPSHGTPGDVITVRGSDLPQTGGRQVLRFGGLLGPAVSYTWISSTEIQAVVPTDAWTGYVVFTDGVSVVAQSPSTFSLWRTENLGSQDAGRCVAVDGPARYFGMDGGSGRAYFERQTHDAHVAWRV